MKGRNREVTSVVKHSIKIQIVHVSSYQTIPSSLPPPLRTKETKQYKKAKTFNTTCIFPNTKRKLFFQFNFGMKIVLRHTGKNKQKFPHLVLVVQFEKHKNKNVHVNAP